jgi:hypothetical protein
MNPIFGELYHYTVREKESNDESLCHYGIKGMSWGKRRFQNEDGSLTNAGRQRFYAKRNAKKNSKKSKYRTKVMTTQTEFNDPVKKSKKKKTLKEEDQINQAAESMRQQTEDLRKHSAVNEHYSSAVRAHMQQDSKYNEYREKAIEDYINSHLSSYDGDRQKMIDKMGDIDEHAMKYYMKDHKDDYHVKGYHATIGNKRTAEREYTKRLKEVSHPIEEARKAKEKAAADKEKKSLERQKKADERERRRRASMDLSSMSPEQRAAERERRKKYDAAKRRRNEQRRRSNEQKIRNLIGKTNESTYDKVSRAAKSRWS